MKLGPNNVGTTRAVEFDRAQAPVSPQTPPVEGLGVQTAAPHVAWPQVSCHGLLPGMVDDLARLQGRFAINVRAFRALRGLTQEQLADRAGIASRHLQKVEVGGVNLTLRTVSRLSHALSVDPSDLFRPERGSE
ncbi:MAG: hypothetical protein DHS20C21_13810 [Gemmatimonadota bacterium]|nr:MAG: hypothetical protein DHS20C21_13810 [Gemmatimonadota bacterium]